MKSRLAHSLEALESRIAPAAVLSLSSRFILTIHTDAAGADLTIVQGADGKIDVLDATHSLMPTGHPQKVSGIVYQGGAGNDFTTTKLQNGLMNDRGYLIGPSLPGGFIISESGGNNHHEIEAVEDFATIGGPFRLTAASTTDFMLTHVLRQGDLTVRGGAGEQNLQIVESSVFGTLSMTGLEHFTISRGDTFGSIFANNLLATGPSDFTVEAELVTGRVIYVGSAQDDVVQLITKVNGAITMFARGGEDTLLLQGQAAKSLTYIGGASGFDHLQIFGSVLGSITAHMGHGHNEIQIVASMNGGNLVLTGGAGVDGFDVTVLHGGQLHVALGADEDTLETKGTFTALYLDGGRDLGIHNGMEETVGRLVFRRNFV
ncbi:MAG TPA: hypothetical protein VGO11_10880 [Chthoniobacteraceae bacterium]|jgi:hypothetical protein|nr:hypothetical protein [Chthoniobacteraceae bacterium]